MFFGSHSNSDTINGALQLEHPEEKAFPDFPNKGLPLDEGFSHFIKRYLPLLDTNQLRLKLSVCNVEIATSCWYHMISCMKQCVSSDDEIMMMLSAGNHDNVVKLLSKNLQEDKISPWLPLYVSRYVYIIVYQYIRIHCIGLYHVIPVEQWRYVLIIIHIWTYGRWPGCIMSRPHITQLVKTIPTNQMTANMFVIVNTSNNFAKRRQWNGPVSMTMFILYCSGWNAC